METIDYYSSTSTPHVQENRQRKKKVVIFFAKRSDHSPNVILLSF